MLTEKWDYPRTVLFFSFGVIFFLLIANIYGIYLNFQYPDTHKAQRIMDLFDFNLPTAIPSLFIILMLFFATVILIYIGRKAKEKSLYWFILAFIFGVLTISKAFHIQKIIFFKIYKNGIFDLIPTSLIIVFLLLCLVFFGIFYFPFFFSIPKPIFKLIMFSMFVFVFGAVVVDKVGSWYINVYGFDLGYYILYTIEEFLEMTGISLFVYGGLRYLKEIH
jgi:hypothetical protein